MSEIKVDYFNRLKARQSKQKQGKIGKIVKQSLINKQQNVIQNKIQKKFLTKNTLHKVSKEQIQRQPFILNPKKQTYQIQQNFSPYQLNANIQIEQQFQSQIKYSKRNTFSSMSMQELTFKLNMQKNQNIDQKQSRRRNKQDLLILKDLDKSNSLNKRSFSLQNSFDVQFQTKQKHYKEQLRLLLQTKKKKKLEQKEKDKPQECQLI